MSATKRIGRDFPVAEKRVRNLYDTGGVDTERSDTREADRRPRRVGWKEWGGSGRRKYQIGRVFDRH